MPPGDTQHANPANRTPSKLLRNITFSRPTLTLLVSIWLVALGNFPFWRTVWAAVGGMHAGNVLFLLCLPLFVLAWVFLLLSLLTWGRATKPVLVIALLISATVGYFASTYGTMLDSVMIANIVQTHAAEALDLVSWRLWGWLLVFG